MDDLSFSYHNRHADTSVCKRISQFACDETLRNRLSFLDQELSVFGYPSIQNSKCDLDGVTLINIVHDLLHIYRKSLRSQSDANDDRRCSESEIQRYKQLLYNAKEDIARKTNELKSKAMMESQLQDRIESLRVKIKQEQERSRKMLIDLTSRDSQYKHEKKKLQQEIDKLLDKLNKLLQDKRKENFRSLEMLNSLKRNDGTRAKWSTDKSKKSNEDDMYRVIISNYEEAQANIMSENEHMRNYIKQMQHEINKALSDSRKSRKSDDGDGEISDVEMSEDDDYGHQQTDDLSEEMFSMPYEMVKDDIERVITNKWKLLRRHIRSFQNTGGRSDGDQGKVASKIVELEKIIGQQQDMIELFTSDKSNFNGAREQKCMMTSSPSSYVISALEIKSQAEKESAKLEQMRSELRKERKEYAQMFAKLNEDRIKFESERITWMKRNFFNKNPMPPSTVANSTNVVGNTFFAPDNAESNTGGDVSSRMVGKVQVADWKMASASTSNTSSSGGGSDPDNKEFSALIKLLDSDSYARLPVEVKRHYHGNSDDDVYVTLMRRKETIENRWKSMKLESIDTETQIAPAGIRANCDGVPLRYYRCSSHHMSDDDS